MKKMMTVCVASVVAATVCMAWDSQVKSIYKVETTTLENPEGTTITLNDTISAASLTAGTSLPAVNGNAVTNLNAANIRAGTVLPALNGGSVTNLNGENIQDDTIDDDSIDFADVTGADLTLTDCGAIAGTTITASGAMQGTVITLTGNSLTFMSGAYTGVLSIASTTLQFVVNGTITNVLDADITH